MTEADLKGLLQYSQKRRRYESSSDISRSDEPAPICHPIPYETTTPSSQAEHNSTYTSNTTPSLNTRMSIVPRRHDRCYILRNHNDDRVNLDFSSYGTRTECYVD
ncbi:hypothetical protein CPB83DRAFT_903572 [Crepidotus variabilis]|uniref:Uncharacterized protein n=1 Tax=Crepidotus variabilis TaxID=179855 RepID=A0A9P6JU39_9AGAR|nr:hypothetical protein CPB83DRAFT_903572 [Crepidotus variabilis]